MCPEIRWHQENSHQQNQEHNPDSDKQWPPDMTHLRYLSDSLNKSGNHQNLGSKYLPATIKFYNSVQRMQALKNNKNPENLKCAKLSVR
jgi:hypothetical protein